MSKILLIDDDPSIRSVVRRILASAGHEVIEAADGQTGLREFVAHRPDVVVTDILMPQMDGIETIRELQRLAPTVWIVAISGGGASRNMHFLDFAKAFGANVALAKPFRSADLIAAVDARNTGAHKPFRAA